MVWIPSGLLAWVVVRLFINETTQFGDDVCEPEAETEPPLSSLTEEDIAQDKQSLQNAVVELTKQLKSKESLIENLQTKLTEREFRRSLSRLASVNETLSFTMKLIQEGKLTDADAVEQLRQEIESAVSDLGLEHHSIQVGVAIASLPAGSFVILRSEVAPSQELAGTVKEVVSSGLYAKDEDNRPHFISPSKIHAYKL